MEDGERRVGGKMRWRWMDKSPSQSGEVQCETALQEGALETESTLALSCGQAVGYLRLRTSSHIVSTSCHTGFAIFTLAQCRLALTPDDSLDARPEMLPAILYDGGKQMLEVRAG
jgi:hypothetical protein